jgi:hypothetical protein
MFKLLPNMMIKCIYPWRGFYINSKIKFIKILIIPILENQVDIIQILSFDFFVFLISNG